MALDLETTYRAILQAARKRTFITYGEIAAANGVAPAVAQAQLPAGLERLMRVCHDEGWPFVPTIVFHDPALGHAGSAAYRDRLVTVARSFGIFISDANAFIRTEQDRVFDWAPGAPDHLPETGAAAPQATTGQAGDPASGGMAVPGAAPSAAGGRLDLGATYRALVQAARRRAFITYGEIAEANGVAWNTVRSGVPAQLDALMGICRRQGWPFLPVIVVNVAGREEGTLTPEARDKLVRVARDLGGAVDDPDAFVRAEQARVFDWAPRAPDHLPEEAPATLPPDIGAVGAAASAPRFVHYFGPVLEALRALGGVAKSADVISWLRESGLVPAEDLDYRTKSGNPGFANKVGWARFYLDRAGFLTSPRRGVWALTVKGRGSRLDFPLAREVFRSVQVTFRGAAPDVDDTAPPEDLAIEATELFSDPQRQFWLAGTASDAGLTARFLSDGFWQVDAGEKVREKLAAMRVGDRIILKTPASAASVPPFESGGNRVSVMWISATGTITGLMPDGLTVRVDWRRVDPPRPWYLYMFVSRLERLDPEDDYGRRLIRFAFLGEEQDLEFWRNEPRWASRFGTRPIHGAAAVPGAPVDEPQAAPDDFAADDFSAPGQPEPEPLPPPVPYTLADLAAEGCFLPEDLVTRALGRWRLRRNLILQGPPGTGKSWLARRLARVLLGSADPRVTGPGLRAVQFHPALSYEEFVRGWRPDGSGGLVLVDGAFLECVAAALAAPDRPHVLLIEEINRGNPARIFGDMLTLIEDTKRAPDEAIELAARRFPGERIFVPDNLFLIGTMNLADRSLALVDLALRRRFAFLDLTPQFTEGWQDWCIRRCGLDAAAVARIGARMAELNAEIAGDRSLGAQFRVGHSFLTPDPAHPPADAAQWFREVVESEIGPLLEEYWFDAPDRARDAVAALVAGM